jgi:hypothetical protein
MKPTLKAPGAKRLKLKCDKMLPNSAFKLNLRRYTKAWITAAEQAFVVPESKAGPRPYTAGSEQGSVKRPQKIPVNRL